MSMSLNKVMIIGNVGRLPEMRYTPNGNPVTTFTVATNRRWLTPEGEPREETEWFRVVAWNKLAETCNQLITNKGIKVYVEGRLQTRSWEGSDGQKRSTVEVIANSVILLDSRQKGVPQPEEVFTSDDSIEPDDLPF